MLWLLTLTAGCRFVFLITRADSLVAVRAVALWGRGKPVHCSHFPSPSASFTVISDILSTNSTALCMELLLWGDGGAEAGPAPGAARAGE